MTHAWTERKNGDHTIRVARSLVRAAIAGKNRAAGRSRIFVKVKGLDSLNSSGAAPPWPIFFTEYLPQMATVGLDPHSQEQASEACVN